MYLIQTKMNFPVFLSLLLLAHCSITSKPGEVPLASQPAQANKSRTPLKAMFGINSYEWNFLENPASPNIRNKIYEDNMALIKSFGAVRHYLNWTKLENTKGNYTFNPTNSGNWYYDVMYKRCKQDGILVLADIKNLPVWMMNTYPADQRNDENVPAPYGSDRGKPASYIAQAQIAFQFAARYGYNKNINPTLIKIDNRPRWANDVINEPKIGMELIKYIECGNENDRWWKGNKATQTAEEYAANMSAFYDGHMGTLGAAAGVKKADPNMQVVMGGLSTADAEFVQRMIDWCKTNRGYKADGSINLCFDVINYHLYANDSNISTHSKATTGIAPELSQSGVIADEFVKVANGLGKSLPVWVTEAGYDINQGSYQHAPPIGNKSPLITQADWILRTSLLYLRHGVKRLFFYQLFDAYPNKSQQYSTSGLAEGTKRRPAADYILQANKLMGNYTYAGTINQDPLIDKFKLAGNTMYILTIPDQTGRTRDYLLNLGKAKSAAVYTLKPGADDMVKTIVNIKRGKLNIHVTETPVFVQPIN